MLPSCAGVVDLNHQRLTQQNSLTAIAALRQRAGKSMAWNSYPTTYVSGLTIPPARAIPPPRVTGATVSITASRPTPRKRVSPTSALAANLICGTTAIASRVSSDSHPYRFSLGTNCSNIGLKKPWLKKSPRPEASGGGNQARGWTGRQSAGHRRSQADSPNQRSRRCRGGYRLPPTCRRSFHRR